MVHEPFSLLSDFSGLLYALVVDCLTHLVNLFELPLAFQVLYHYLVEAESHLKLHEVAAVFA